MYVYLVTLGNIFKVGFSKNPMRRYKQYKTHNPEIVMLGIINVESKQEEKSLHRELLVLGYTKSKQPEWFEGQLSIHKLHQILYDLREKRKKCGIDYANNNN